MTLVRIISVLLSIVGSTFLIPIGFAIAYNEYQVIPHFLIPMICSWLCTVVFLLVFRKKKFTLKIKFTFVIVAIAWISTSLFGALPLFTSGYIPSFTDAFFESVSGFSTTGATILSEVENLPRSLNLYRCQTQWLGGMGIVALTVALLPLLGVGGFQLIKAETTGPEKGKLTPKITTTAKYLWLIYVIFTAVQTILLAIFGMDFIDAVAHAFSTLGTGGFSTKNNSIAFYDSVPIDVICTIFMFLAGINFTMYYFLVTKKFQDIKDNSELKAYCGIWTFCVIATTLCLLPTYKSFGTSLRFSAFQVSTIMTTTGFASADFTLWPLTAQFFILLLFFIGGCSGSTAGGIKVIRWVILNKQLNNETKKMLHPHGVFSIRLNNQPSRKDIVFTVAAFIFVYLVLVSITTFIGCIAKLDLLTSFTTALSMVGNIGPGFGSLGPSCNYGFLPAFAKWWYCFAMLAGRLELYTMIIFFLPEYWKK